MKKLLERGTFLKGYSFNVKKSEMVTLQKSEKRKDHSNRVKITLKTSTTKELSLSELPQKVKVTLLE